MTTMQGRVALVTGSTRGIGKAIARLLAAHGARVAVHGRSAADAVAAASEIPGAVGVSGEISDPSDVHRICEQISDLLGPIEIAVNNAGTSTPALFLDATDDEWDRMMAVNLYGPRNVLREVLPHMRRQRWGRILNVVSEAGVRGTPRFSAYAATKGALLAMSFTLAHELSSTGICVNALAPVALTDLVQSQLSPPALDALVARGFPSVEDCAQAALPLVADDPPTGQLVIMHFGAQPPEVVSGFVQAPDPSAITEGAHCGQTYWEKIYGIQSF